MTDWGWIALAVYVVGFFLTPYVLGRLTRGQGIDGTEDGCGMLAVLITWPIWLPLIFAVWLLIGLPMALLKKGQRHD